MEISLFKHFSSLGGAAGDSLSPGGGDEPMDSPHETSFSAAPSEESGAEPAIEVVVNLLAPTQLPPVTPAAFGSVQAPYGSDPSRVRLSLAATDKPSELSASASLEIKKISSELLDSLFTVFQHSDGSVRNRYLKSSSEIESSLTRLDTAYLAGSDHGGYMEDPAQRTQIYNAQRTELLKHLHEVESDYRSHSNTIENVLKKTVSVVGQDLLETIIGKEKRTLEKSLDTLLSGSLVGHASPDHAGASPFPNLPSIAGGERDIHTMNVETLNVAGGLPSLGAPSLAPGWAGSAIGSLIGGLAGGHPAVGAGSGMGAAAGDIFSHLETGGDFRADTPFIAGDPGPAAELVVPTTPGHVYTAAETKSLAGAQPEVHHHQYSINFTISDKGDPKLVKDNANSIGTKIAAATARARANRVGGK